MTSYRSIGVLVAVLVSFCAVWPVRKPAKNVVIMSRTVAGITHLATNYYMSGQAQPGRRVLPVRYAMSTYR